MRVNRRLRLPAVMLRHQIDCVAVLIPGAPHCRGAIPANVQRVDTRPVLRNLEVHDLDFRFRNRVDRSGAKARNALRTRIAQMRRSLRQHPALLRLSQVRNIVPASHDERLIFTHLAIRGHIPIRKVLHHHRRNPAQRRECLNQKPIGGHQAQYALIAN